MNKQFFVLYFKELDSLVVQTAPIHAVLSSYSELKKGVDYLTHSDPSQGNKIVGFTIKNISNDVSFISLIPHMVQSLGVNALELTSALINAEVHIKSLKEQNVPVL